MELQVVKSNGKKASKIMVDASVFNVKPSVDAVHRAILSEMENSRQGTHGSKSVSYTHLTLPTKRIV